MSKSWQSRSAKPAAGPVTPSRGKLLQRKCACGGQASQPEGECEDCKKKKTLQRQAVGPAKTALASAPPIVHEVLNSPGQPLESATRNFFEPRFGHDFGKVRVHTDQRASESASDVNALAYTVGNHVVFASGRYDPSHPTGRGLLGHELAHTVQQQDSTDASAAVGNLIIGDADDLAEKQADAISSAALEGGALPGAQISHGGKRLQRQQVCVPRMVLPRRKKLSPRGASRSADS